MSNRAKDPAFPQPASKTPTGTHPAVDGVTIREHLAGQALIGVMIIHSTISGEETHNYKIMAHQAVAMADHLLLALKYDQRIEEDPPPADRSAAKLSQSEQEALAWANSEITQRMAKAMAEEQRAAEGVGPSTQPQQADSDGKGKATEGG